MTFLTRLHRRTRNLFYGLLGRKLRDNIFFLHVPKCGGTSIDSAIRSCYPNKHGIIRLNPVASHNVARIKYGINFPYETSDDYPILKLEENLLLYFMSQKGAQYISGHFSFVLSNLTEEKKITDGTFSNLEYSEE